MNDISQIAWEGMERIVPENDQTRVIYISGGNYKNEIYTHLPTKWFPAKRVLISELKNITALWAAMIENGWIFF